MKKTLAFLVFLFSLSYLFPQNTVIFNHSGKERFTITSNDDIPNSRSRKYFQLISIKTQKPLDQIDTRFEYFYDLKLYRNLDKLRIKAEMTRVGLRNDITIQGFPVNKYLHPKKANCIIQWLDEDDNVLREFYFSNIDVDKKYTKLVDYTFTDSLRLPKRYKLKLVHVQGYYSQENLEDMDKVVKAIAMYYDADARASLLLDEVKDIQLDNIEILDQYNETIEKIDVFVKNINTKKLEIKLKYPVYDPNKLSEKLARLNTINDNIQASLKKMRNFRHEAYYKRGVAYKSENDVKQAKYYLYKSYKVKDNFAPSLFELAHLYYDEKNYDSTYYFIYQLVYQSTADQNLKNQAIDLGYKTFEGYSKTIDGLVQQNKLLKAGQLLDKTYATCMEFKKVSCLAIFEDDFFTVYNARFESLNKSIHEAIEKDDLILAENYVDSVFDHLDKHSKYIKNPEVFTSTLQSLYTAYLSKSTQLLDAGKPEAAFILLTSAQRLCLQSNYLVCTSELANLLSTAIKGKYDGIIAEAREAFENNDLNRAYALIEDANKFQTDHKLYESEEVKTLYHDINHKYIEQNIEQGKTAFQSGNYGDAVKNLEKAQDVIDIHNYSPYPELDSLLPKAVEKHSQQLVENAEALVKGNKMIDANDYVEQANDLARKYDIEALDVNLQNIDKVIQSQECSNVKYQIDIQLLTSKKFATQQDFLKSYQALQKAEKFSQRYDECTLDTNIIFAKMDSLSHIAQYQNYLIQIETLIQEKSYESAIDLYRQAGELYRDRNLSRFDIVHKELVPFIQGNASLNFINFCVKYFVVIDRIDHGIQLTETLYKRQYPSPWAKNNQVILGTALAVRDFARHPTRDPKLFVTKYIHDDRWFRHLKRAYLRQWRKLK